MPIATDLTRRLGIRHPVLQAPMAGGATTIELVAAVCESGGAGFVAAAYSTPEQIADFCRGVRARTRRPFGVNLFAPLPMPAPPDDPRSALERIAPFHAELGIDPPSLSPSPQESFDAQLEATLAGGASYFSFTFGIPPSDALAAVKAAGMFVIGTATTVEEAIALESAGVDAVVAQGSEAGAHRGSFAVPFEAAMVGTIALVPQVVRAIRIPVIASGGIMNGDGIVAALGRRSERRADGHRVSHLSRVGSPGIPQTSDSRGARAPHPRDPRLLRDAPRAASSIASWRRSSATLTRSFPTRCKTP